MNRAITTIFKALGVLALSAFIFFLFMPKERVTDQAMNLALEFLGKKLLAMVPKEHESEIGYKFEAVRKQALQGEINDEHLEDFATFVLNAEAEGQPLEIARIDSALVALHATEAAVQTNEARRVREEKKLEHLAKRIQEFEQFEKRWQTFVPDSTIATAELIRVRPFYRVSKNFVVQIDTAALAQAIAQHSVQMLDSVVNAMPKHFPPPLPPRLRALKRNLEGDMRDLRIEWHSGKFGWEWADSVRVRVETHARGRKSDVVVSPQIPEPPPTEAPPALPHKN